MNWNKSEEWKLESKNHVVIVKHWKFQPPVDKNMWNVYALIYPGHARFDSMCSANEMFDDAPQSLPMHGGATFFQKSYNAEGKIVSVKVGCDYAHYMDDRFEEYETKEDAASVFFDAGQLFKFLDDSGEE